MPSVWLPRHEQLSYGNLFLTRNCFSLNNSITYNVITQLQLHSVETRWKLITD